MLANSATFNITIKTSHTEMYDFIIMFHGGIFYGRVRVDTVRRMAYAAVKELQPARCKY